MEAVRAFIQRVTMKKPGARCMPRPNIVVILTDQQRADTIHAAGNPVIRTPHMDRLVREGVLFSAAYTASPVCVPARCSLILGQYPHRTACTDNGQPMPEDRPTFMRLLAEAGYRTHGIGKMHFTPDADALRGFQTRDHQEELRNRVEDDDYVRFLHASGFDHVHDPSGVRGEMYYIPQPAQMPARLHPSNWVGDRAVDFLKAAGAEQPYLLFVSFIHPHPPFCPPTPWHKLYRAPLMPLPRRPDSSETLQIYVNRFQNRYKYRDSGTDNNLVRCIKAYYYACISFIDFQVGRMIRVLEDKGQLDSTLILFVSDHGELLGDYYCFGKRSMHDAASRVPLIVRYPERFAAGQTCSTPVSIVDIMPTLLRAAGLDVTGLDLDGLGLDEIASADTGDKHADRTVYSQYQREALAVYMALNRRWKYFYSVPDRREFLFDRVQDPEETRDRAGLVFCRQALAGMRSALFEFYRRAGFTQPLDGDHWRHYPQPSLPENPDAGLLVQDAAWSVALQAIPGYSDGD
jgi:arylsulfatase A-like enzyme